MGSAAAHAAQETRQTVVPTRQALFAAEQWTSPNTAFVEMAEPAGRVTLDFIGAGVSAQGAKQLVGVVANAGFLLQSYQLIEHHPHDGRCLFLDSVLGFLIEAQGAKGDRRGVASQAAWLMLLWICWV